MTLYVAPILFVLFAWWFSTGVVLFAVRSPFAQRRIAMIAASVAAGLCLVGLYVSAGMETVHGAYLGFLSALGLWAWHELIFLTGTVTGPRRLPCPSDASGFRRFQTAFLAVRDHEVALAITVLVVAALTWNAPNQAGLWAFLVLWVMRLSAKLTVFFGAPNAISQMTPDRLTYLTSYFRTDRTTPAFPALILMAVSVLVYLITAVSSASDAHTVVGLTLTATFLALAIVEHFFLVLPISDAVLWRWAMPKRPVVAEIAPSAGGIEMLRTLQTRPRPVATCRGANHDIE